MTWLVITIVSVIKLWSIEREVALWNSCAYQYSNDLRQCAVQYPDQTDIRRALCEATARGRYQGCLDSWQ